MTEMTAMEKSLEFQKIRLKTGEVAWIVDILEPGVAYIVDVWQPLDEESEYRTDEILHSDIECLLVEVQIPVPMPAVITEKWQEDKEWLKKFQSQHAAAVA
jgi:hypothetical protein